jgi:hypothetical protein
MDTNLLVTPGTDPKFWDGFLEAVRAQGIRAPYDRWYVIRGSSISGPIRIRPSQGTDPRR